MPPPPDPEALKRTVPDHRHVESIIARKRPGGQTATEGLKSAKDRYSCRISHPNEID
ncbi:protein of unknown function [Bradyrhizobium vignae]|uniref:Uncharacterized protein n=1 Tax=Bradyrhizobium vignae TaxID=1549949 RepID=A0A2U3PUF9_9BRAD|nr:protein of unknown function [Bradyrhizobium vignae]